MAIPEVKESRDDGDIVYPATIPFLLVHLICLAAIWTGVTWEALAIGAGLYFVRVFGITAGYHRYFSHKAFKTGRVRQFLLAFLAQTSLQRGVLWWAAKHRQHHRYSDTPRDDHSPLQHGFWFSHLGWIFSRGRGEADYDNVRDWARYPELVWLDRHKYLPGILLAAVVWLTAGWPGLVVGFFWSTVLVYHATFCINSLAHVRGRRRYVTGDDSRNNWFLATISLGEGWHNNHHYFPAAARQGFRWWELDVTFYALKLLSWLGLVRDLRKPPAHVLRGERRLPRALVERVAERLAGHFPVDRIIEQMYQSWPRGLSLEALHERKRRAWAEAEALLNEFEIPALPSFDDVRGQAARMFSNKPSIEPVVARTHRIVVERVLTRLMEEYPRRPAMPVAGA
jgi:stearoyl-CoA desaturase (delta-9 desaturase)